MQYIAVAEVNATNEELLAAAPVSQVDDETALSGYANETALTAYDVIAIPTVAITLWYHYGPQGETRYLTDLSGNVTDSYQYDAYGIPLSTTGTFYNPHRYGEKHGYHSNLNPAGLVLAGSRWYSPQLRRWVSRDPIAYEGGENLYGYVGGRPVRSVDPTGLCDDDGISDINSDSSDPDFLPSLFDIPDLIASVLTFGAAPVIRGGEELIPPGSRVLWECGALGTRPKFKSVNALHRNNRMVQDVVTRLGLGKEERQILHREIGRHGLTYQQFLELAKEMLKK